MNANENDPDTAVEIWHARAASDRPGPVEAYCEQLLLSEEKTRADRFRVASARHQHVIGRGMARALLAAGRCNTHEIDFHLLEHGKPIVRSPESARRAFNVAHTHGLVVCGLADRDQWLGVDVEWMDRRTDPQLARRYFAPAEVEQLDATASDLEHRELFLRLWTLKEAFIKAIGTGLFTPLDQFAFEDAASDEPKLKLASPELACGRTWRFETFAPRPGFTAAIAIGQPETATARKPTLRLVDFEGWLESNVQW